MNKKLLIVAASLTLFVTPWMTGCRVPGYVANNSFGAPYPGALSTSITLPSYIAPKMHSARDVQILGDVYGSATATDVLMLFSSGNCGIAAAKADALKNYPEADDILNMEVDTKHISLLSIFNAVTTEVRGKAVKYKK